jgi:hypothetical protein
MGEALKIQDARISTFIRFIESKGSPIDAGCLSSDASNSG